MAQVEIDVQLPDVETVARQLWDAAQSAVIESYESEVRPEPVAWPPVSGFVQTQWRGMAGAVREWLSVSFQTGVTTGAQSAQMIRNAPSPN